MIQRLVPNTDEDVKREGESLQRLKPRKRNNRRNVLCHQEGLLFLEVYNFFIIIIFPFISVIIIIPRVTWIPQKFWWMLTEFTNQEKGTVVTQRVPCLVFSISLSCSHFISCFDVNIKEKAESTCVEEQLGRNINP